MELNANNFSFQRNTPLRIVGYNASEPINGKFDKISQKIYLILRQITRDENGQRQVREMMFKTKRFHVRLADCSYIRTWIQITDLVLVHHVGIGLWAKKS